MNIHYKEKLEITRVIVSTILLVTAIYGMINYSEGWGWFLTVGFLIYPNNLNINLDFKDEERGEN